MCYALCLAHGAKLIKLNVYILADNGPSYIFKNLSLALLTCFHKTWPGPMLSWRLIMKQFLRSFSSLLLIHSRRVNASYK